MQKPTNLDALNQILKLCWCQETCYPDTKRLWNVDSTSHYYNEIDGCIIDFTNRLYKFKGKIY